MIPPFADLDNSAVIVYAQDSRIIPVVFNVAADFSKITFSPIKFAEVGNHTITVTLKDDVGDTTKQSFVVTVINDPPFFTNQGPTDQLVRFNTSFVYTLPTYADNENN